MVEKLSPQEESNTLHVSDLTEMECMVRPLRVGKKEVIETYRTFFQPTTIHYVPLSKEVFRTATRLRANFNLKTPDALHLAFAIEGGCEEFWTNDLHLEKAVGERLRIVLPVG